MNRFIPISLFVLLSTLVSPAANTSTVTHQFITSSDTHKKVEFFWSKPEGRGPWPMLLLIHPHQEWPNKIGGESFVKNESIGKWTSKGWLTVAISQPGYSQSEGPADFCGPHSQQAVLDLLQYFRAQTFVKQNKIVLYGGSRGAVIASIVATKDPLLAGVILRSGLYNLVDAYKAYPWYSLIKWTMIWELGFPGEEDLKARSAFFDADKIKASLLLFHGGNDDRASIEYAKAFTKKVNTNGEHAKLITFDSEHIIPQEKIASHMEEFLKEIAEK